MNTISTKRKNTRISRSALNRVSVFLCILLLFSFSLSASTWHVKYKEGRKAAEKQKWERAVNCFLEALKDRRDPKVNARTVGMNFVDYLPYYYLGMAYYHTGKFKEALYNFKKSLTFGEISKKSELLPDLQEKQEDCRTQLKTEKGTPAADPDYSIRLSRHISKGDRFFKSGQLDAASREFQSAQLLIRQKGEPPQGPELADVKSRIQAVAKAREKLKTLDRARAMANKKQYPQAVAILKELLGKHPEFKDADRLLKKVRQQQNALMSKDAAGIDETQGAPSTANETTALLMEKARKLLENGKIEEARQTFSRVLKLETGHPDAGAELKKIDNSPAVSLNNGIRKYFMGEHDAAESHLRKAINGFLKDTESPGARKKRILACQFLAIVLIERHFLEDDPSKAMLKEAGNYISRILKLEPHFNLDARYFSPKVKKEFDRLKKK